MTDHLGHYAIGATVDYTFATFTKDQTTRVALSSGSVGWYAGAGTSAIKVGTTLTSPWSSNTGVHHVQTVFSQANGFAGNNTYTLRFTAGTADSVDLTGAPLAMIRLGWADKDGAILRGSATSMTAGNITLTAGLATAGSVLIALESGSDATGKSRIGTYTGASNIWTVDPPFNKAGEALPASLPDFAIWPLPPSTVSSVATVNVGYVSNATLTGSGTTADPWRPA